MFRSIILTLAAIAILSIGLPEAEATPFRNLDFEEAVISQSPPAFAVPASEALPFWTCNNYWPGYVIYDEMALDGTFISVHDSQSQFVHPIEGNYSVMLQSDVSFIPPNTYTMVNAFIAQTGDIPGDAKWLRFQSYGNYDLLVVSLNGVAIPMSEISADGDVKTFAGDISAFANTTAELRFELLKPSYEFPFVVLDGISVPEPSTFALLGIGATSLLLNTWRRRITA